MREGLLVKDIVWGIVKSVFFGLIIGLVACYRGLTVKGGAAGVGAATTSSVVTSHHDASSPSDSLFNILIVRAGLKRDRDADERNPPATGPLLSMENVVLRFGDKTILDGIDLAVQAAGAPRRHGPERRRQEHAAAARDGHPATHSRAVRLRGQEVNQLGRRELNAMRAKIGMVYQYSALISSLNVRDNLALPMEELTDMSEDEIERTIDEKLDLVQMSHVKHAMPAELSGGMKKRIGLARALVLEPELILFDEPSAGLDPVTSSVIDELIISLTEQTSATSIIVTHEMDSAFRIATRMVMLYEGKFIADGTPEKFRHSSTTPVVAQFVEGRTEGPIFDNTKHHAKPKTVFSPRGHPSRSSRQPQPVP